uniref:Uncharacterized protein n=1 Tax=viral metagenome TaxID=1070528 RepID=A0A6C0HSG8_9ZZZZ
MQTRSQTRKFSKVHPDVKTSNIKECNPSLPLINSFQDNRVKMLTRSKSRTNLNSFSILPNIENNETNEINIVTRSRSKKYNPMNTVRFIPESFMNTMEKIEDIIDIDFDDSSRAWMRNKRKLGNGEYSYQSGNQCSL